MIGYLTGEPPRRQERQGIEQAEAEGTEERSLSADFADFRRWVYGRRIAHCSRNSDNNPRETAKSADGLSPFSVRSVSSCTILLGVLGVVAVQYCCAHEKSQEPRIRILSQEP
jgi:hypothetical protein